MCGSADLLRIYVTYIYIHPHTHTHTHTHIYIYICIYITKKDITRFLSPLGRKLWGSFKYNPIPSTSLNGLFYYKIIGKF